MQSYWPLQRNASLKFQCRSLNYWATGASVISFNSLDCQFWESCWEKDGRGNYSYIYQRGERDAGRSESAFLLRPASRVWIIGAQRRGGWDVWVAGLSRCCRFILRAFTANGIRADRWRPAETQMHCVPFKQCTKTGWSKPAKTPWTRAG